MLDSKEGARSLDDLLADESATGWLQSDAVAPGRTEQRWIGGTAALPRPAAPAPTPRRRRRSSRAAAPASASLPVLEAPKELPTAAPVPVTTPRPRRTRQRRPRPAVRIPGRHLAAGLALGACSLSLIAALASVAPNEQPAPPAPVLHLSSVVPGLSDALGSAGDRIARELAASERRATAAKERARRAATARYRAERRARQREAAAAAARSQAAPVPRSAPSSRASTPSSQTAPRPQTQVQTQCELGPC